MLSSFERVLSPKQYNLRMRIRELIDLARGRGLPEFDLENALEALEHNEFGDALDTVLVQLFEHNIGIDNSFIVKAREACDAMQIEWKTYQFAEALVR